MPLDIGAIKKGAQSGGGTPWGAIASGGLGILGMIGQKKRERRQVAHQKELMDYQKGNQMDLNMQGYNISKQLWEDTNLQAQVEQAQKAGLNPGLLYGQGGQGGSTSGQGGGSAQSGSAPKAEFPMEIGAALQAAQLAEQLRLMKAQAKKTAEEAKSIEIDNVTKERFGHEADLMEASNRRDAALKSGQSLFENAKPDTHFGENLKAQLDKAQLDVEVQKLVKRGLLDENKVKLYKGKLAEAGIDPDSNPVLREIMKAMAENGVPLNKLLAKAVEWFIR